MLDLTGNLIPSRKGRIPWPIPSPLLGMHAEFATVAQLTPQFQPGNLKVNLLKNSWVL